MSKIAARAAGVVAWTCTLACTLVSDQERFPPVAADLRIEASVPSAEAVDVAADARIDLCLSARVDPRTVDETAATLGSGQIAVDTELNVQLVPWEAPGIARPHEDADTPWCDGSVLSIAPQASLLPGLRYRVRVQPTFVGWNGEALDTDQPGFVVRDDGTASWFLEFTVAGASTPPDPPDPAPPAAVTLTDLYAPGGPLDPARGLCSCHLDPDDLAFSRLDLRTPQSAQAALLGSAELRDTGFPMISPREPSQSFFVHKLVRDVEGEPLHGLLGDAMPPDAPLAYADLRPILEWIASGSRP